MKILTAATLAAGALIATARVMSYTLRDYVLERQSSAWDEGYIASRRDAAENDVLPAGESAEIDNPYFEALNRLRR